MGGAVWLLGMGRIVWLWDGNVVIVQYMFVIIVYRGDGRAAQYIREAARKTR